MEMQLSTVTNRPVFMNRKLEKVTQSIMKCAANVQTNRFAISAMLADVQSEGLYKDDGFANAADYAMATFAMEKTLAYDLIRMGQQYVRPILNDKGRVIGYCSNLLPPANPDAQDAPLVDFTPTQIIKFSSLGREKVLNLIMSGELNPRMTIKEIVSLVKACKQIETSFADKAEEPMQEPAEEPVQEPAEEPVHEPRTVSQPRPVEFDNVSTEWLIAEIRARGFKVFDHNNVEMYISWYTE